jgi:hypothetical protein
MSVVAVEVSTFAQWLTAFPKRRWNVDGENSISDGLSFPCTSSELVAALTKIKRNFVVFVPEGASSSSDLTTMAAVDPDGGLVFELAWADTPDDHWFVIQDVLSERAFEDFDTARSA